MCPVSFGPVFKFFLLCVHLCRNPAEKRPGSALKQHRRDNGGRQHRGAGPGGHDQGTPKRERFRDTRGPNKDKVGLFIGGFSGPFSANPLLYSSFLFSVRVKEVLPTAQVTQSRRSSAVQDTTSIWWSRWRETLCHVTPMYTGTLHLYILNLMAGWGG